MKVYLSENIVYMLKEVLSELYYLYGNEKQIVELSCIIDEIVNQEQKNRS